MSSLFVLSFYYAPNRDTVILTVGLGCGLSSWSVSPVRIFGGCFFTLFYSSETSFFLSAAKHVPKVKNHEHHS